MAGRDPQYDQRQWKGEPGLVVFGLAIAAIPFFGALAFVSRRSARRQFRSGRSPRGVLR